MVVGVPIAVDRKHSDGVTGAFGSPSALTASVGVCTGTGTVNSDLFIMQTIQIHFDGGCRPTNPGNKYGSYEIVLDGTSIKTESELELGKGTNNEAEFEILIQALTWCLGSLKDYGYPPERYALELFTDSTIVSNRINGRNRSRQDGAQQRMFALSEWCLSLMKQFGRHKIQWVSRERNVERFGH